MMLGNSRLGNALDTTTGSYVPDYSTALDAITPDLSATISDANSGTSEPWYVTAAKLIPTLMMTEQQRQLMQVQVDRAKQGLPPLDTSQYAGFGVNVGVNSGTQKTIMIVAGSLAAAYVVGQLAKRR